MTLRVTVVDVETGDTGTTTVQADDYILVCADPCYRAGVQAYANGTHVITVKGRRQAVPAPDQAEVTS